MTSWTPAETGISHRLWHNAGYVSTIAWSTAGFGGKAMVTREELQRQRSDILAIAARYGATNVRLFGSLARGDALPGSDVDILIDLEDGRSLLDLCALEGNLEDLLGCPVDVGLARALRPRVAREALRDAVPL